MYVHSEQADSLFYFGEAERTRTVIVFIDNEVHTPFCHGLKKWVDRLDLNLRTFDSKSSLCGHLWNTLFC